MTSSYQSLWSAMPHFNCFLLRTAFDPLKSLLHISCKNILYVYVSNILFHFVSELNFIHNKIISLDTRCCFCLKIYFASLLSAFLLIFRTELILPSFALSFYDRSLLLSTISSSFTTFITFIGIHCAIICGSFRSICYVFSIHCLVMFFTTSPYFYHLNNYNICWYVESSFSFTLC